MRDAAHLAAMASSFMSEDDLDDLLMYLARYSRQSIAWFEEQPLNRVFAWAKACERLIALENGKRPSLDLQAASEENR